MGKLWEPTLSLKGEVALRAVKRTDVRMGPNVFPQHAWFLATDSALFTDVFSSPTSPDVHVILIRFVTEMYRKTTHQDNILCGKRAL